MDVVDVEELELHVLVRRLTLVTLTCGSVGQSIDLEEEEVEEEKKEKKEKKKKKKEKKEEDELYKY